MTRTPMTLRGAELLRAELKRLKSEDRPRVIKSIAEARSHGDLSENAEYHAAREQQGFIEGRIMEIESRLGAAEIIDVMSLPATGRVVFGAGAGARPHCCRPPDARSSAAFALSENGTGEVASFTLRLLCQPAFPLFSRYREHPPSGESA